LHANGLKSQHYSFIGNLTIFLNGILIQIGHLGFSKLRCFQRSGHCVPLSFTAFGGKIQATRYAGGR